MKRILSILLLLGAIVAGAQTTKQYTIQVGDFNELTVGSSIDVVYRCVPDSAGTAVFFCQPDVASNITFSCDKYKLKILLADDTRPTPVKVLTVYSTALNKAVNWGDSTITVCSVNPSAKFVAEVIGNGTIVASDIVATQVDAGVKSGNGRVFISGKTQSAKLTNWGKGAVEAADLEAAKVKCNIMGTGAIDCYPLDELTITGASGKIYYRGNPKIKNRSVGTKAIAIDSPAQ